MQNDVIIIGGGLGGLFTGALLAREGLSVTIVEKNAAIGGGLQTFHRFGSTFDTGMHTLGGFNHGDNLDRICRYLGIRDQLCIKPDDCLTQITNASDGVTYHIDYGREGFVKSLAGYFPHETENLKRYVDTLYRLTEEVPIFHLRDTEDYILTHSPEFLMAADELIAAYITDERLRDLLAFMNPMYGGVAGHTPAYVHALINVLYINRPYRFVDDSAHLARLLAGVIKQNGGQILAGEEVTALEAEGRHITAVCTRHGHRLTADTYIAAIHPLTLSHLLPPGTWPPAYRKRLEQIALTNSAFTVYITFKPETFPYIDHTCYWQADYGLMWQHAATPQPLWPQGFMYFTPPVEGQSKWAEKMVVNCVMDFKETERWSDTLTHHRGEDYEQWKAQRIDAVVERLTMLHPDFRDKIAHIGASTPLTIRDYYHTPRGALFGYAKDCHQPALSYLPVRTKADNLLLTGQNVNLHGICGVPLTAIVTAEALTGRNHIVKKIREATPD